MQNNVLKCKRMCAAAVVALWMMAVPLAVQALPQDAGRYLHKQGTKSLKELVQAELDSAAKKKQGVVLMFTSDWCSPCKAIKEYVHVSAVVRKALIKGRLLFIDVDEWRGPAQSLIPGEDASKLPTLVRLGPQWQVLQKAFGSEMGLLHEDAVAHNLVRLLEGKPIEKPFYASKPELERELVIKQSEAQNAKLKGLAVLAVQSKGAAADRKLHLTIHNLDGPRRWFLIPARLDQPLSEKPNLRAWWKVKWSEHVRADFLRLQGSPEFYAVPVAGYGSVDLSDLAMPGKAKDGKLEVWELDWLKLDGQDQSFQMKLPYQLTISHFDQQAVIGQGQGGKIEFRVHNKHKVAVK